MDMDFITWQQAQAEWHAHSGSMHGCPPGAPSVGAPSVGAPSVGAKQHWGDHPGMLGVLLHSSADALDDLIAEDLAALDGQQPPSDYSDSSAFDLAGAAAAPAAAGQPGLPAQPHEQAHQQPYQHLQPTELNSTAHADIYSTAAPGCAAPQAWFDSSAQPLYAAGAGCGTFQLALGSASHAYCPATQPDARPDLAGAGSPTSSSAMTAGFSSAGGCSSSRNPAAAAAPKRRRSEELDEDYRAPMGHASAAVGNSKAKPKQQRISWQRHAQELQHLEQRVATLTASNNELQKKVRSLNDDKTDLLSRLMSLTGKWRGTVEANDQLQRRELAHERTIATLEQELVTLRQQQQQAAGP